MESGQADFDAVSHVAASKDDQVRAGVCVALRRIETPGRLVGPFSETLPVSKRGLKVQERLTNLVVGQRRIRAVGA